MKKLLAIAAFALTGATALSAGAIALEGSDTLESLTKHVLNNCSLGSLANTIYGGGGSTNGEIAVRVGNQQVAPMSRFLLPNRACAPTGPGTSSQLAEGLVVALDGLAMVVADATSTACGGNMRASGSISVSEYNSTMGAVLPGEAGLQCPGCSGSTYSFTDWRDVLKVIYAGVHHDGTKDCNSDVRHTIAEDFNTVFQSGAAQGDCAGCSQLRRAFRRADLSGTTDTFLALLGLPAINTTPFCNGVCFNAGAPRCEDKDPIRRACTSTEGVCSAQGDMGLVVSHFVPENLNTDEAYPSTGCAPGNFAFKNAALTSTTTCVDGTQVLFGLCLVPQRTGNFADCINPQGNISILALPLTPDPDGRAYNLELRGPSGALRLDATNQQQQTSWYRLHTKSVPVTTSMAGNTNNRCREISATRNIGCSSAADGCTIGFSGREAFTEIAGATGQSVNGIANTVPNIQALITGGTTYPMARKLYLNTLIGFENVVNTGSNPPCNGSAAAQSNPACSEEQTLMNCFNDTPTANAAAVSAGFVQLPGGVVCEDFDDTQCPGDDGINQNACANN